MSMDIDIPFIPKLKKHRKSEGGAKDEKKKDRKRKRKTEEEGAELASPIKKHKVLPEAVTQAQPPPGPTPTPKRSPFYTQTSSLYLPIAPVAQMQPLAALCAEHISPLLLSYYPPFHGLLISYSSPRLSSTPHDISAEDGRQKAFARSVDEYAATFVWLIAEFLVFRPQRMDVIEGYVNLQSENSIGIVYWNFFNASIQRKCLPKTWKWTPGGLGARGRNGPYKKKKGRKGKDASEDDMVEKEHVEVMEMGMEDDVGFWQDRDGRRVEGLVRFYVKDVETSRSADRENGFLGVEGSIVEPGEDHARPVEGRLTNGSVFGGDAT